MRGLSGAYIKRDLTEALFIFRAQVLQYRHLVNQSQCKRAEIIGPCFRSGNDKDVFLWIEVELMHDIR